MARPSYWDRSALIPNDPKLVCDLELQLGSKLHDSWSTNRAGDPSKIGAAELAIRRGEVCLVEYVEDIPAKLKRGSLGKLHLFHNPKVEPALRVGSQNVSTQAAIDP